MPKLRHGILLLSLLSGLSGCGLVYEEYARLISTDETIDSAGNIVQTSHWEYPDGEKTTTTQTIPPTAANERRRGPGRPVPHLGFDI